VRPIASPPPTHSPGGSSAPLSRGRGALIACHDADDPNRARLIEFLDDMDLSVVPFNAAGDQDKSLIEQIEAYTDLTFAVILIDAASPQSEFDLGFCAGRLGSKRVVVVHVPDHDNGHPPPEGGATGALYTITFDPEDGWQLKLARHLRKAGIDVDLNRLV
ncbi:MAG: hypothetical protein ACREIT_08210, partial [Tepidisphaeraceae bacterium]